MPNIALNELIVVFNGEPIGVTTAVACSGSEINRDFQATFLADLDRIAAKLPIEQLEKVCDS